MKTRIWTITQLVSYLKEQLSNDFILRNISVQGEIGNFTNHFSGHWYFTLKDNTALINCAMFKGYNSTLKFIPKNGDKLLCTGNVSIFEKSGQLQLIVTNMQPVGAGNFYQQFALMKEKLEPLGFFDNKYKKPIPKFPKQISVITGANTAALQDIRITAAKRWPVQLVEVNALVQGDQAVDSIVSALKIADSQNSDIIILARGGGSVDDLWCFNDEKIARTIFACKTPVITGIGHEIDTTIADLVADLRAATPTAAATLATPDYKEVKQSIFTLKNTLITSMNYKIESTYQVLDYYNTRLMNYSSKIESTKKAVEYNQKMLAIALSNKVNISNDRIENLKKDIENNYSMKLKLASQQLNHSIALLDSLSPLKTMQRGYIISKQNGKVVKSVKDVDYDQCITLKYADGELESMPIKKKELKKWKKK